MVDHLLTRKRPAADRQLDGKRQLDTIHRTEVGKARHEGPAADRRQTDRTARLDDPAACVARDLPALPHGEDQSLTARTARPLAPNTRGQGQQAGIGGHEEARHRESLGRSLVTRKFRAAETIRGGTTVEGERLLLAGGRKAPDERPARRDFEPPLPGARPTEGDLGRGAPYDPGRTRTVLGAARRSAGREASEAQRHRQRDQRYGAAVVALPLAGARGEPASPPAQRDGAAIAALLLGLLMLARASAAATTTAPAPRPDVRDFHETVAGGWVTIDLEIPSGFPPPRPVVISPIIESRLLLERGIGVARFRTHWETLLPLRARAAGAADAARDVPPKDDEAVGEWLLRAPRPGIVGKGWFGFITQDAEHSLPRVLDVLARNPFVDAERISIAGSSTSGFIALQAMVRDRGLGSAVVQVACGDYFRFLRSSRLAFADDPRWTGDDTLPLDPDYAAELARIEPVRAAESLPPRPLLLMTGARDRAIPRACVEHTAAALRAAYAAADATDRFEWIEFPDDDHSLAEERIDRALEFWDHWLLDGESLRPALRRWNRAP